MESRDNGRELLARWRTFGESDPQANRQLAIERVIEYRAHLVETYTTRTPKSWFKFAGDRLYRSARGVSDQRTPGIVVRAL